MSEPDSPATGEGNADDPVINIRGERVGLGPLDSSLLPLIVRWQNDFTTDVLRGNTPQPSSRSAIEALWEPLIAGQRPDWIGFAIYELATNRPIGILNVRDYVNPNRTAEFGISIGDPADRGKGYGSEATILLLGYAYDFLGVHNVWLDTLASNLGAIRAYERAGFRRIGVRREAHRIGDHAEDVVLMDCLRTDFRALGGAESPAQASG